MDQFKDELAVVEVDGKPWVAQRLMQYEPILGPFASPRDAWIWIAINTAGPKVYDCLSTTRPVLESTR